MANPGLRVASAFIPKRIDSRTAEWDADEFGRRMGGRDDQRTGHILSLCEQAGGL